MKPRVFHTVTRPLTLAGFTLLETLVAAFAVSVLIASLVSLGIFTSRSFFMMGNYVDLDAQSRNAVDILGRDIRDSSALLAFSTNSPQFLELTNGIASQTYFISYYTNNGTLMLTNIQNSGTTVQMLLTNCDEWTFTLYDRVPNTNSLGFYSATNSSGQLSPRQCKVINMSWKCSRTMLGTKFTTESVQTAQIVLRNKISN